jgi:glycosyltransferase involved in cell wall biosynthesis
MKILYDYQAFYSQNYGGISRYFCEIVPKIVHSGDQAKIIAGIHTNRHILQCPSKFVFGCYIPPISRTWRLRLLVNNGYWQWYLKTYDPDIIHQTYYLPEAPKNSRRKSKLVITIYDMLYEKFKYLPKSEQICEAKSEAIKQADHIICISENTRQDLLNLFDLDSSKVSVVYLSNSFNIQNLEKHNSEDPFILYVGNRGAYKNFNNFLKAYSLSSNLKNDFKVICFGGGLFSQEEIKMINDYKLPKLKIQQISGNDEILVSLYSQASIFVYPSLYEGFGIPLLEAMSLGCPVVCSNTSSMPEVAGNAAEFFDPYDPESITVAMETVLYSSEKAEHLLQMGKQRVKKFSWQKCADETRSIYLSLV